MPEAFINAKGKPCAWCSYCRASYRNKFIKPKEVVAAGVAMMAIDIVARDEGYADHPLAKLLALSHIAGAKRAIAIRDGKSWRGKKAWRAYYEAKRELESKIHAASAIGSLGSGVYPAASIWPGQAGLVSVDAEAGVATITRYQERDQKSGGVSSK